MGHVECDVEFILYHLSEAYRQMTFISWSRRQEILEMAEMCIGREVSELHSNH
jgi:hypothetical protein